MDGFQKEEVLTDMGISMPAALLKVQYDAIEIKPGQVMTPTQVQNEPVLHWEAEEGAFYTVIMNDPDAPSRQDPKFREYHHWMVGNVPGNDVSKGEVLSDYVGSGPPQDTGLHRYVFLVYKQAKKEDFSSWPHLTNRSGDGRASQKATQIGDQYGMTGPVAANFYQAEYDDYVPLLYKQLSGK